MKNNEKTIEEDKVAEAKAKLQEKEDRVKTEDVTKTKGLTFESFDLPNDLQLAIYEMGYDKPSPIQEEAIPLILEGK